MTLRSALALLLLLAGGLGLGYGGVQAARSVSAGPSPHAAMPTSTAESPSPTIDLAALAEACATVPGGRVAAYLEPATLIHGTEPDPRTQQTMPVLRATFDNEIPAARPTFSVAAVVQEAGRSAGAGARPIDNMGSLQLWLYWDGDQLHKGLRRWSGTAWMMAVDDGAGTLTIELHNHSAAFHSGDVKAGATFAVVTADAQGCAALGLDSQGRPASRF
jgi:hypothetical protein